MKSKAKREITITLSEREACWLRSFIQNYPSSVEELPDEYIMRKELFDALTGVLTHPDCKEQATNSSSIANEVNE